MTSSEAVTKLFQTGLLFDVDKVDASIIRALVLAKYNIQIEEADVAWSERTLRSEQYKYAFLEDEDSPGTFINQTKTTSLRTATQ